MLVPLCIASFTALALNSALNFLLVRFFVTFVVLGIVSAFGVCGQTDHAQFSTQTRAQRSGMKRLRRRFLRDYRLALARWNAGERDVVFPPGTVRMRLRHKVMTEPVPLELLLGA